MTTPSDVIRSVAFVTGIPASMIIGKRRSRMIAYPRFLAFLLIKERTPWITLSELGETMGGRDHGTAIHGLKRAKELLETDPDFKDAYESAKSQLTKQCPAN